MSPESIQRPPTTDDSEIPGTRPEVTLSGGRTAVFWRTVPLRRCSTFRVRSPWKTCEPRSRILPFFAGGCEACCHDWRGTGFQPVLCALRSVAAGIIRRAKRGPRRSVPPSGAIALRMRLRGRVASSRRWCRHRTAPLRGPHPPDIRALTESLRTRRRCTRRSHRTPRRCRSNFPPRGSR